jgi:two-component system heavy metal sensor histidine kinase CusS
VRLKHRLSLALTLVAATALGASFATAAALVHRNELADLDRGLASEAEAAAFLAVERNPRRPALVETSSHGADAISRLRVYAAIYALDGSVVSQTAAFAGHAPAMGSLPLPEQLPSEGRTFDLAVPGHVVRAIAMPIANRPERILYAVSRKPVDEDLRFLTEVLAALFLAATSVTALVARWLGARLSADVDAIAEVARSVASGDLGARVGGVATGSTETRDLGHDLDHMIEQLDELVKAQLTFVSHAAHELRSPLTTLRGELQLALRRPRTAEGYKEAIEHAGGEVEALVALAEDLLVLARVQRGGPTDAVTAIDDAVADACKAARGPAEARGVRIDLRSGTPDAALVRGKRADIARALRNVVDNAVEHTIDGGAVQIAIAVHDGAVEVTIDDEGPGVAPIDAPHVFSPFYRGAKDRTGEARGTGLGLAIVREIVRASRGDVRLAAKDGPGARFVVELPVAND